MGWSCPTHSSPVGSHSKGSGGGASSSRPSDTLSTLSTLSGASGSRSSSITIPEGAVCLQIGTYRCPSDCKEMKRSWLGISLEGLPTVKDVASFAFLDLLSVEGLLSASTLR